MSALCALPQVVWGCDTHEKYSTLILSALVGSGSWLLFTKRLSLAPTVILAVLWSLAPVNLRIIFMEGNLPWVLALSFLPLLLYLILDIQEEGPNTTAKSMLLIIVLNLVILSHAMVAAIFMVGLTIFLMFNLIFGGTSFGKAFRTIMLFGLALAVSAWWLLPSLTGGIIAINKEAVSAALGFYSPAESLNPFLCLESRETFYFGLSYLIVAGVAVLRWRGKEPYQKAGIAAGLLIFALTIPVVGHVYKYVPLNHLALALLLIADSWLSVGLINTRNYPFDLDAVSKLL